MTDPDKKGQTQILLVGFIALKGIYSNYICIYVFFQATAYIYTDMQTTERHQHALGNYI